MATISLSGSWVSSLPNQFYTPNSSTCTRPRAVPLSIPKSCARAIQLNEEDCFRRRSVLVGIGALVTNISGRLSGSFAFAEEVPKNYRAFVDYIDGYSYYYPADWRDFDFLGHDSAFKDRTLALQHVRVSFKPTDKKDIRDLGSMDEVIYDLVKNVFAAPIQRPTIFGMQERTIDGKNYWTFEYELTSPNFSRTAFATIAIGNGRYYTLVVGANERRWSRFRDRLKVVADSFRLLDI